MLIFLCTEECRTLVLRWRQNLRDNPKAWGPVSVLLLLLAVAVASLILYSFWLFVGGPGFSYD